MRVLLLHRDDDFFQFASRGAWDLIVDMGRAPIATYESWRNQARCEVISLYDLAGGMDDLRHLKLFLKLGSGHLVDRMGMDWWDLLFLSIASDFLQLLLLQRLVKSTGQGCDIYSSRLDSWSRAFQILAAGNLTVLETFSSRIFRLARHYSEVAQQLDTAQTVQVIQDKFDSNYALRSRFGAKMSDSGPAVLLPSAYANVSRTAAAYAGLLPDVRFLMVLVRNSARLRSVSGNVRQCSLNAYFSLSDGSEIVDLLRHWEGLQSNLSAGNELFQAAESAGILRRIPSLLRWGTAVRDAWCRLFERHDFTACLSADDSNPSTRIPLLLAKRRGIPALACHHGALDCWMAVKTHHENLYLTHGEMERDYLERECVMPPEKMFVGSPSRPDAVRPGLAMESTANWLVFFTEAYRSGNWRQTEIYRDLVPRLTELANSCQLELVFKIHPFESVKDVRRMLSRYLSRQAASRVKVIGGHSNQQLWQNTRVGVTSESTVAVECARLGIPVFACGWLRDSYSGYVQQYARFGVCHVLNSSQEISKIPQILAARHRPSAVPQQLDRAINPEELRHFFSGVYAAPIPAEV